MFGMFSATPYSHVINNAEVLLKDPELFMVMVLLSNAQCRRHDNYTKLLDFIYAVKDKTGIEEAIVANKTVKLQDMGIIVEKVDDDGTWVKMVIDNA